MPNICKTCSYSNQENNKFCCNCGQQFRSQIEELHVAPNDNIQHHTCWIGNISTKYNQNSLEKHFEDYAKQFGRIHSIKIMRSTTHDSNQCYINFFEEKGAEEAVKNLNGANFDGLILETQHRKNNLSSKNIRNNRNQSARRPSDDENLKKTMPLANYKKRDLSVDARSFQNQKDIEKTICIPYSKYLKFQLEEKLKVFKDIPIEIIEEEKTLNLTCKINCTNEQICKEIIQKIKEWKVYRYDYKLQFEEFNSINDKKNELLKRCRSHAVFIEFNKKYSEILVYSFEKDVSIATLEKIKQFVALNVV